MEGLQIKMIFCFESTESSLVTQTAVLKWKALSFDAFCPSFSLAKSKPCELQIMVCPCAILSNCVFLQITFCSCVIETMLLCGNAEWFDILNNYQNKLGDRMIKQLLSSVITKYRDLSVSHWSIICLSLWLWQIIIDLLTTNHNILLNLVQ